MKLCFVTADEPFRFEAGGSIDGFRIAYHTSPTDYKPGMKVIWICHALTANSDAEDWWNALVGPGRFLDTEKYFIVCVNMPGSPYGTTGPSSVNPATGEPWYMTFPEITIRDMAGAMSIVRKHLGINKIDLLIGSSIGGFQAIEWAVGEPEVFSNAIFMATDARVSPWLTAQNEAQRLALEADQTFRQARSLDGGKAGLRCARAQALISYRSYSGFRDTQSEVSRDTLYADRAASYERYQGDKLVKRFDAYSYWYLTHSLDSHNIGRGRGGVEAALKRITARTAVVGINSDNLFPEARLKEIAGLIPGAEYYTIDSKFGHDGFLLEHAQLTEILKNYI